MDTHFSSIQIPIIGYHRSPLSQKFGTPRQPNLVDIPSHIEMVSPYHVMDAFEGILAFSYLWILWQFHQNRPQQHFKPQVRPPRLGGNQKMGVFASRSMYRPSGLGMSVVQLIDICQTEQGVSLQICGADMVDGTPIIDIKPYLAYSDSLPQAKSGYAQEIPSIKTVSISPKAEAQFLYYLKQDSHNKNSLSNRKHNYQLNPQDLSHIKQLIAQDPRPAYRQHETDTIFIMRYKYLDVHFFMNEGMELVIVGFEVV